MSHPRRSNRKGINQLVAALARDGWAVTNGAKHPRVVAPDGQFVVFSVSPSNNDHAYRSFERDVRRVQRSQQRSPGHG